MSEQSDLRNFFGKRNAETDQEPSSSGCSASVKSEFTQNQPRKKIENSYLSLGRYKWLRYENDMMFCDTCLTAKACSNPFIYSYIKDGTPIFNDETPS